MSKIRVYEVARQLGLENRELLAKIASLGIQVRNHMSSLEAADLDRVKRALEKEKQQNVVEEHIRPTVVRRRVVSRVKEEPAAVGGAPSARPAPAPSAAEEPAPPAPRKGRVPKPMPRVAEASAASAAEVDASVQPPPEPPAAPPAAPKPEPGPAAVPPESSQPGAEAAPQPAEERAPLEKPERPPARRPAARPAPVVEQPESVEAPPEQAPPEAVAPPALAPPPGDEMVSPPVAAASPPSPEESKPAQVPSYEQRLGNAALPPGVISRGGQVAAGPTRLSAAARSRIVSQHTEQRRTVESSVSAPPRRRELARAAIGPTGRQQMRPGRAARAKKPAPGKKTQKPELTTPSAQKRVIRIEDQVGLQTLAQRMSLKATEVLMKLMQLGMTGVMINSTLDADTAKVVASEFGFEVENVAVSYDDFIEEARGKFQDTEAERETRAPVVTVMGHVDHGKTSLLDRIRKTNVVARESGGITQHLGAYRVDTKKGPLVFLDTPGHAAFTAMRARGAHVTDVVVLVVAADDGAMPQTKEAINHARDAEVPIVVAVNKIDKPDARPEAVRRELAGLGLQPEEWGGDTIFVDVSAATGDGVDELLESISLQSEMLELRSNPKIPGQGVVLEAYVDRGRGPVANLLVQEGMLKTGSIVVAGGAYGKVRAMTDDRGKQASKAGPSVPVEVLGLSEIPAAGDTFHVVTDTKVAQQLAERRKASSTPAVSVDASRVGLDQLFQKMQEGEAAELKLVVKADVQGSAEALVKALGELSSDKVRVNVIHSGVGAVTENDVMLAFASSAIVIGFQVRPTGGAVKVSKSERVEIRTYRVIYDVIDDVKAAMAGLLKPELVERSLGRAEVRQVFALTKGKIAGCFVADGKLLRSGRARLVRDSVPVWEGAIKSLRRVKDDVREVASGLECGVALENFSDIKENDIIECFEVEEVAPSMP